MGAISWDGAAFFSVGGVCPVNRSPFSLGIFLVQTMKLVKEVLPGLHGKEAVHGDQICLLLIQRASITKKSLLCLVGRKPVFHFYGWRI